MKAASVASVLIPLNPETTTKDTIQNTIQQLEEAMEAVKASSAPVSEQEYIDAPEVVIHVQEDSAMETLEPPTESQVEVILTGVRNLRCKGLSDEECDVALTGSSSGLKVEAQTELWEEEDNRTFGNASSTEESLSTDPGAGTGVAGARRLLDLVGRRLNTTDIRYFVNFTCFLIIKRDTYLDETVELSDSDFGIAFMEQVVQIQVEKAANNDTGNASATATLFVSAVPIIQPAVSKALTVVTLAVQEEAPIDVEEFQQKVTDAETILAAIEEVANVSDVYDFVYGAPITDLCYDRDCSGHGTCIEGTCQCDAGYSRPNCLDKIVSPLDILEGEAVAANVSLVMSAILFSFLLIFCCLLMRKCRYQKKKGGDGKGVITPDLDVEDESGVSDEQLIDGIIQGVHVPRPAPQPLKNPGLQGMLVQADVNVEWSDSEDIDTNALVVEQGIYTMDSGSENGSNQDAASEVMDPGVLAKAGISFRDMDPEALAAAGLNITDEASEDVDALALAEVGLAIATSEEGSDLDVQALAEQGITIQESGSEIDPQEAMCMDTLAEQGITIEESGSETDPQEAVCMDTLAEHGINIVESEGDSEAMCAEELIEQGIFMMGQAVEEVMVWL